MSHCITTLKTDEVTYKWELKSFQNYMNLATDSSITLKLSSSYFSADTLDNERFNLTCDIIERKSIACNNEIVSNTYMSLYLQWKKFDKPTIINYKLYILNNKNEKCFITSGVTNNTVSCEYVGDEQFIKIEELNREAAVLLPNTDLTLGCDVVTYGEMVHDIIPAYERQPCESIDDQLSKLMEDPIYSDFTFIVGNKQFNAHELILKIRCPVFQAMFNHETKEKQTRQCIIEDIHPKIFKIMLKFIYTDKIVDELNDKDAMALLLVADKYELHKLQEVCVVLLCKRINIENVVELSVFAKISRNNNFIKYTSDFIHANRDRLFANINFGDVAEDLLGIDNNANLDSSDSENENLKIG